MSTLVYVDPRLPVDPSMSPNDPAHPRNLVANLAALEAQALADTVYDAPPPKRDKPLLEAFSTYGSGTSYMPYILALLVVASLVSAMRVPRKARPSVTATVAFLVILFGLYAVSAMNPRCSK